ncbi:hypothetical protein BJP05_00625 [Corynebacterium sp. NML98-0116]|nr:hypothetical protein BJP05_00625 [Corynebacterium sp. NML98-0116]
MAFSLMVSRCFCSHLSYFFDDSDFVHEPDTDAATRTVTGRLRPSQAANSIASELEASQPTSTRSGRSDSKDWASSEEKDRGAIPT